MHDFTDTTPKPSFLRAIANQKWTVAGALSELVDNSLGAIRGNARHCRIQHDKTNRVLIVLDDGQGMDEVGRLFQLGNTIGMSPKDIGIYGSGGTMGIIWLPRSVEVWSLRDGKVSSYEMVWEKQFTADHYFLVPNAWRDATPRNTPHDLFDLGHGTMIKMQLRQERNFFPQNVIRDLSETYAPAIRNAKVLTWQTISKGNLLEERSLLDVFEAPSNPSRRADFSGLVTVGQRNLPFVGCIGLIDGLPHSRSVVSIGFQHRRIFTTRDCYQSLDGDERFHGTGIAGWIDLGEGWQPYLSTTKDEINDGPVRAALMGHIFAKIRHLLRQTEVDERRVLLNNIALNLQAGLCALSSMTVDVAHDAIAVSVKPEPDPGPTPDIPEIDDPTPIDPRPSPTKPEPEVEATKDPGDAATSPDPALSEIIVEQARNEYMDGALCRVEIDRGGIIASVNEEHDLVIQALIARPINRSLLHWMIARELARAIIEDSRLVRRLFTRPALVRHIESLADDAARERYIARLVIDSVHQPIAAE